MTFEVSERFASAAGEQQVLAFLRESFQRVSEKVLDSGNYIVVSLVNATFGSINRADETTVSVSKRDSDLLLVATVNYKPSVAFWIIFILCLFSTVGWLIPLGFYFYQKKTVREAIQEVFLRTRNEFSGSNSSVSSYNATSLPQSTVVSDEMTQQIERLGSLMEKGLLSKEEFELQKKKLLGL